MLRKYLWGTQGRPELCFGGFGIYGNLAVVCVPFNLPVQADVCILLSEAPHHHSLWLVPGALL